MSFDPGADKDEVEEAAAEQENQTRAILEEILKVLLRIEKHLAFATLEEMEDDVH